MISLTKGPYAKEICRLYNGKPEEHHGTMEGQPVYWLPKKDPKYRLEMEDAEAFLMSDEFRIRYRLAPVEQTKLVECLLDDKCPEDKTAIVKRFYDIRADLKERMYEEMILNDNQYFRVDWPEKKDEWSRHVVIIASTGAGKTWLARSWCLHNLQGPRNQRRNIIYASTELEHDKTLQPLLGKRYEKYVTGVDTSDEAFENWKENDENAGKSIHDWFESAILPPIEHAPPGSHVFLDDSKDSPADKFILKLLNKALRTYRHKKIGVTSLQHAIRGRDWTSQSFSSVFGVVLFPNSGGKGKQVSFLADDIGFGVRRARQLVKLFAETGRECFIRMHTPTCCIGTRAIVLT